MSLYSNVKKVNYLELFLIIALVIYMVFPNFMAIGFVISVILSFANIFTFFIDKIRTLRIFSLKLSLSQSEASIVVLFLTAMSSILFFHYFKLAMVCYSLLALICKIVYDFFVNKNYNIELGAGEVFFLLLIIAAFIINANLFIFYSVCLCLCQTSWAVDGCRSSRWGELICFYISLLLVLFVFSNFSFMTIPMVMILHTVFSSIEVLKFSYKFYSQVNDYKGLFNILANINNLGLILCIVSLCISSHFSLFVFCLGCAFIVLDNLLLCFADIDISLSSSHKRKYNGSLFSALSSLVISLNPWLPIIIEMAIVCLEFSFFNSIYRNGIFSEYKSFQSSCLKFDLFEKIEKTSCDHDVDQCQSGPVYSV